MKRKALILLLAGCSANSPLTLSGGSDMAGISSSADLSSPALADLSAPPLDLAPDDLAPIFAGGADGTCSPGSVSTGLYDPDCVYLVGTLRPGSAGWGAFVYPGAPNDYAVGFYSPSFATIRPTDGRLLFLDQTTAEIFQPPPLPSGYMQPTYISQQLDTPACPHMVGDVFVFPDDGRAAYECLNLHALYLEGESTSTYTLDPHPLALGAGRVVLGEVDYVVTLFTPSGNIAVTNPWTQADPVAARFAGDGFLVAVENITQPITVKQLKVSLSGAATVVGDYQVGGFGQFRPCSMEPGGALECTEDESIDQSSIQRFTLNAPPQLVYSDAANPVKVFIPMLATGP